MKFDEKMKFILCALVVLLTSCKAVHKDITYHEDYSDLIGAKFRTLTTLRIHGVTHDWPDNKEIDEYVVTELPGFGGREVITAYTVPTGSIIQINKVIKCANCLPPSIDFDILVPSEKLNQDIPIKLYDYSVIDKHNNHAVMDPKRFARVK